MYIYEQQLTVLLSHFLATNPLSRLSNCDGTSEAKEKAEHKIKSKYEE